jgi:hypothetical protein
MRWGRRFPLASALSAGLTAGIGYPLVSVALACRAPSAEACVWGKAYLPLNLALSVLIVGGIVTGLCHRVLTRRRSHPSHE